METFKIGDHVYVKEDFIDGEIVDIKEDVAYIEFRTPGGGGCLPFRLSELEHEKMEMSEHSVWKVLNKEKYVDEFIPQAEKCTTLLNPLSILVGIPLWTEILYLLCKYFSICGTNIQVKHFGYWIHL